MSQTANSKCKPSPLISNPLSGLGRIRKPSERAGEITEEQMSEYRKEESEDDEDD